MSESAAEYVDPKELVPWARNPRKNEEAVEPVMNSIREFGFAAPIVARLATKEIIVGHTRWRAACNLGLERVPVRFLDITEDQAHRLALADNKLGEISKWDFTELASVFGDLAAASADAVKGLGFDKDEIDKLLKTERTDFLDDFTKPTTSEEATAAEAEGTTRSERDPMGFITFSIRLAPEQDQKLQAAIQAAKKKFGVRTNIEAVLSLCDTVLGG